MKRGSFDMKIRRAVSVSNRIIGRVSGTLPLEQESRPNCDCDA